MKVILLENVDNLGQKYDVKEVKDGYARNFLIPQKLAKIATLKALVWLESQKEEIEKLSEEALKQAQETASFIEGQEVTISMKVGDEGQLFESVSTQKIADQLKKLGRDVKKSQIIINRPIKELGEHQVKIKLEHNLETEITVLIIEEEKVI